MTILVVDDSRIMRNIVKNSVASHRILRDADFLEAADGISALDLLEHNQVDLLLLDWNMPRLNGIELVREMRSRAEFAKLPIVMITSEAAKYNVIEAVKAGVSDYLIKPVSEKSLIDKIKRIFPEIP
ncbi:response regulator [Spirochaeta africana]|uniref:Response regulator containing a CheY-like receiver domain and a GGDEF domain n=1 Tax=Spirochaeta africana (strain ATCC 700263 / DSM 8902 / Z-7692) TaxID=889378 RepID=H9UK69_SPIAZ|nr:response regulator [Spirochaeta africana]AFG37912.1 response regulator containing a CheY-like receiver domain and a GGDEF domain [Spirochaeta africana DSM 8902]